LKTAKARDKRSSGRITPYRYERTFLIDATRRELDHRAIRKHAFANAQPLLRIEHRYHSTDGIRESRPIPKGRDQGCYRKRSHAGNQWLRKQNASESNRPLNEFACQPCQEERKRNYQSAFEIGKRPEFEQLRKDQQRPVPKIKRIADDANVDGCAIGQHDSI